MATYIMFFGFTEHGLRDIKESPKRVEAAKQSFHTMGVEVKTFYAVMGMGQHDTMFVVEAADEETVAKAAMSISSLGYVHTDTHRAFTESEYRQMIGGLL